MNAIEVNNITFSYENKEVLKDFSVSIRDGEFFGIIGPNGAGKTTLLKLIASLIRPIKGNIKIFDKSLYTFKAQERAKTIGFVPQENYFGFNFSVLDIVLFGRHPYLRELERPKKTDYDKALSALKFTDALELRDRSVLEISSGERQRVVLARALAAEPKILLLDEPTSYLDITHQIDILKILKKLNNEGITIIFLSHDLNLTSLVCSRLLLMSNGQNVICDTPDKVITSNLINKVYNINPHIISHPDSQRPQIILPL